MPFTVSAERTERTIRVLAELTISFPAWGIVVQGIPFLANLESPATVEVLLAFTRGPGNQAAGLSQP